MPRCVAILCLYIAVSISVVCSAPAIKPSVIGQLPDKLPDDVKILNRRRKYAA